MGEEIVNVRLRMPARLRQQLDAHMAETGKKSLNAEIWRRVELSLEPDPASELAEALRPLLARLSLEDQVALV